MRTFRILKANWILLAAASLACIHGSVWAAQGVTVTSSGSPSYAYPIAVPPGIAGLVPALSIKHDSGRTNSSVGFGWALGGISVIARCHGSFAVDGAQRRGVSNSPLDKLCLDGQRLIQTDDNGNASAASNATGVSVAGQTTDAQGLTGTQYREFRTEVDKFLRIRAYGAFGGDVANGPAYFKVWQKNGQVQEYGNNLNAGAMAVLAPVGKSLAVAWGLSRTADRQGNYMNYNYQTRDTAWGTGAVGANSAREWTLSSVVYTGTSAQAPANQVSLIYEDRANTQGAAQDRSESYFLGTKSVSIQRLKEIRTLINLPTAPVVTKTVRLSYNQGSRTGRSRLTSIQECAAVSTTNCLPAVRFEYSPGADEGYSANAAFSGSALSVLPLMSTPQVSGIAPYGQTAPKKIGILTGDFNGDGRTDLLRWGDDAVENQLWFSKGDGTFERAMTFNITSTLMRSDPDPCHRSMVVDINGDGLADILRLQKPQGRNIDGVQITCSGSTVIYIGNGDGTFTERSVTGVLLAEQPSLNTQAKIIDSPAFDYDLTGWTRGETFFVVDVNGDGYMDIVTALLPFQEALLQEPTNPCAAVVCTRVFIGNGQGAFSEIATNVANKVLYAALAGLGQSARTTDLDGDGLPDIVDVGVYGIDMAHSDNPVNFRSRGDGNFDEIPGTGRVCDRAIDFNGDTRKDCFGTRIRMLPLSKPRFFTSNAWSALLPADGGIETPLSEVAWLTMPAGNGSVTERRVTADADVADIDEDGRQDIIYWNSDPTKNAVYLSNGDGTFRLSSTFNLKAANHLLRDGLGTASFHIGNFTGRGANEILRLRASPVPGTATSNQLYVKQQTDTTPDRLIAVVSPTGARTAITWVPLTSPSSGAVGSRYKSDRATANAARYPNVDVVGPTYVVATLTEDTGVGSSTISTEYAYAGLKANHLGRGQLGFREFRKQRPTPSGGTIVEIFKQSQTFPYVGMPVAQEVRLGGLNDDSSAFISKSETVYCDQTAAAGAEATATLGGPCPVTAKVVRPYDFKKTEQVWDLASPAPAAPVSTTITTRTVNDTGDTTRLVVNASATVAGVGQTFVKTTDNVYKAKTVSGDNWLVGQLERTVQTNTVPDVLATIAASVGTSRYAASTTVIGSRVTVNSNSASALVSIKGATAVTGQVQFANTGDTDVTLSLSRISAPYSVSATSCFVPAGGTCAVTVSMSTAGVIGGQGTQTLIASGASSGAVAAPVGGTLLGSSVAVTGNTATTLAAIKGGSAATGVVTVANSGNQAVTVSLSGLSAP